MVELLPLGVTVHHKDASPVMMLYVHGAQSILPLYIGAPEAYAIASALRVTEYSASPHASEGDASLEDLLQKPEQTFLPASIDALRQAALHAQERALAQETSPMRPRPTVHELLLHMLEHAGATIVGVEIVAEADGIFYADAILTTRQGLVRVDCRPSDGIILALQTQTPLRCKDEILAFAKDIRPLLHALPVELRDKAETWMLRENQGEAQATTSGKAHTPRVPSMIRAALAAKAVQLAQKQLAQIRAAGQPTLTADTLHAASEGAPRKKGASQRDTAQPPESPLFDALHEETTAVPTHLLLQQDTGDTPPLLGLVSEDTRISALLQFLSPETKEPM